MLTRRHGAAFALVLGLFSSGCGPRYVKGTEIEYSSQKQELADLVERYRVALVQRDADALRAMVSRGYFENGSTTSDPSDDYNHDGLMKVLDDLKSEVKAVRYDIQIKDIAVYDQQATVDFEYESQYLIGVGDQDRWSNKSDKNRLTFRKEKDGWRIVSGM
ncbi:MAG: hypothetical protein R3F60_27995 [bacterium]